MKYFVAIILLATSLPTIAQTGCPKGEKRLRPTEECLPPVLFNYLYCLEKSVGGKIEVRKKDNTENTRSLEIALAGSAGGVVLKGSANTGYKNNDTAKAVRELEERIDPSLAAKCQAIAKLSLGSPVSPPAPQKQTPTTASSNPVTSILSISEVPDLSETRKQFGKSIDDFKIEGPASIIINPDAPFPGHFKAILPPVEHMADIAILFNRGISANFYLTARIYADDNIGTIELKGLGANESSRVHFIIDNARGKYYIWAGEQFQRGWFDLNIPKIQGGYVMGLLQRNRDVVFFLNDKKVTSFTIVESPRPGLVGFAFKRQRYISPEKKWLPTNGNKDAIAIVDSVAVYEF